jgi:hypothetical protein
MNFLKKLFSGESAKPQSNFFDFTVKCNRCGEAIEGHINLANDLSLNDDNSGYFVRKVVMGGGRCFQQVEVELTFDSNHKLLDKQVHGGTFVESV